MQSLLSYNCGIVEIEPKEYARLDLEVHKILTEHGLYFKPSCKERLYMPRSKLGRGLSNIEDKSERILLQFNTFLNNKKEICARKRCYFTFEKESLTQLGLINEYLQAKYNAEIKLVAKVSSWSNTKARWRK